MANPDPKSQWKQKYFSSLEELESKEQAWEKLEGVLRSACIRLSLVLDGRLQKIDYKLDRLRKVLRDKSKPQQVVQLIEDIAGEFDKQQGEQLQQQQQQQNTYRILIELVNGLNFPSSMKTQVKSFKKELLKCGEHSILDPYLSQLHVLLEQAFQYYLQQLGNESRTEVANTGKQEEPVKTSIQAGLDVLQFVAGRLNVSAADNDWPQYYHAKLQSGVDGQVLLELADRLVKTILLASNGRAAQSDVSRLFLDLIDRLDLPEEAQQDVLRIQQRLENQVRDDEWTEIIAQLADLVSGIRKTIQEEKRELETFLTSLTERLQYLDRTLQGVNDDRQEQRAEQQRFNSRMQTEVNEIRSSVQNTNNISELRQVVEHRLDAILLHLEQHRKQDEQKSQEAQRKIDELHKRIQSMENESGQLRSKVARQRQKALLDRLTQIPNRAAYDERLDQEYRRWRRFPNKLSMVIVDLDHFKSINDNFGHKAGDKVLATVAGMINKRVRETDFFARYGGEEFVLLMTGAGKQEALKVANEIREVIASAGFHFRGEKVPVTLSCGIAEFEGNDTPDTVFERADDALYRAKGNGRNRCETG